MDVVELAPDMRPAGDLGHGRGLPVRGLIERPETGIAISLQEAVERGQVRARMLAPAIGRVGAARLEQIPVEFTHNRRA
jgi:hypothetical protein